MDFFKEVKDLIKRKERVSDDFVVIDSMFPARFPFGFRNVEVNGLFKKMGSLRSYTMFPMRPGKKAWFGHGYGVDEGTFLENKAGYLKYFPENEERIKYLYPNKRYSFKLAYTYFLAETYTLLPFLERNKIPFVFVLYPGGAFGLNNESSDDMLLEIFRSRYFRKVITTQKITYDYIREKLFCPKDRIEHIFGGYVQFDEKDIPLKKLYKKDKNTFDICFVAAKYTPRGVDKGYDLFIESARRLAKKYRDMRFHVVGGFNENDIEISDIRDQIFFYGLRQPGWLKDLYPRMDISLTPNRPFQKYEGDFDGFPMGLEQSIFGVAMFTTDVLGNNDGCYHEDEIVFVGCDVNDIVKKVEFYYNNIDLLYELSEKGCKKTRKLFNVDERLDRVVKILEDAN